MLLLPRLLCFALSHSRIFCAAVSAWLLCAGGARAEILHILTTADALVDPAPGTLRRAIADAADGDTIVFAPQVAGVITLAGAELVIEKDITISGPGADTLAISGGQQSRIFRVMADANVVLAGLALRDGKAADGAPNTTDGWADAGPGSDGGAILNEGELLAQKCRFTNNRAGKGGDRFPSSLAAVGAGGKGGGGGAIWSNGNLRVYECAFDRNAAGPGGMAAVSFPFNPLLDFQYLNLRGGNGGSGGSIAVQSGRAVFERSSFSFNEAGHAGLTKVFTETPPVGGAGGAIYTRGESILDRCTLHGNAAGAIPRDSLVGTAGSGGALYSESFVQEVRSCTITANSAGQRHGYSEPGAGGGISVGIGVVLLRNTIVAGNEDWNLASFSAPDVAGRFTSLGHNLIGASDGSEGFHAGMNGDIVGYRSAPVEAKLGVLARYGGFTETRALLPGSPALDAGDNALDGVDQRGINRRLGANVDIGAFESEGTERTISFPAPAVLIERTAETARIVVQRSGDVSASATVAFATEPGSALPGLHYVSTPGTVEFAPGETQAAIEVPIVPETAAGRTFVVRLTAVPTDALIHPRGAVNVTVDGGGPGKITFAAAASTHAENSGVAVIKVIRDGVTGPVSIWYSTVDGTATGAATEPFSPVVNADFVRASGQVTFEAGVAEQTITIPIMNDGEFEVDETFTIQIGWPSGGAAIVQPGAHTVTIQSDDPAPILGFLLEESVVSETAGSAAIHVVRQNSLSGEFSIAYEVIGGTASEGSDFTGSSGTFTFTGNRFAHTILIPIVNDALEEGIETIVVRLFNPTDGSVLAANHTHTVHIVSDDGRPAISFLHPSARVKEPAGDSTMTFPVTVVRSGHLHSGWTARLTSRNGTAVAGRDYRAIAQTISFEGGVTNMAVNVEVLGDQSFEPDEHFSLTLSQASGVSEIGAVRKQTITIVDENSLVAFARPGSSVTEESGTAMIEVIRSGFLDSTVTARVTSADGLALGGQDYSPVDQTLTFPPGVQSLLVSVPILDDGLFEPPKAFSLSLSEVGSGTILASPAAHVVTVLDTDSPTSEPISATAFFDGLGEDPDSLEYVGFSAATTTRGRVTGTLRVRGKTLRLSGAFAPSRVFSQTLRPSPGFSGGALAIAFTEGGDALEGTLHLHDGTRYSIRAPRRRAVSRQQPPEEAGVYTAVLEFDRWRGWKGAGLLRMTVNRTGAAQLSGLLPDGSRMALATHLTVDGSLPLYLSISPKKTAALAGFATIAPQDSFALRGELLERRTVDTESYPVQLIGAPYIVPANGRILDDFNANFGSARLLTRFGGVGGLNPISFRWNGNNTATVSRTSASAQLVFRPKTGLFQGSFTDDGTREFKGICVQRPEPGQDIAVGFWNLDFHRNRVELVPEK